MSNIRILRSRQRVEEPFDFVQKIIIIGDSGVGKSNILLRYTEGKFVDNYMMTIGLNYVFRVVNIEGVKIKLQIWDTAGQEKYKTITQAYYRNSEGVLVVFAVDSRDSFQNVQSWIEDLTLTGANSAQIFIIGNKCDLTAREVTYEEASELASRYGVAYLQCSAKSGYNIDSIFMSLGKGMKSKFIDDKCSEQHEGCEAIKLTKQGNESNRCCKNS